MFSPDGRWFAYHHPGLAGGEGLVLFETATGREIEVPGIGAYFACAVAPHQPWIAVGSGRQVRLIHFESREVLRTLEHPAEVGRIAWSREGRKLAVACAHGDVFLWDFEPEHFHVLTGHSEFVGNVAFSPDDQFLLTAGLDNTTRLWDCDQGQQVLYTQDGQGLRFCDDGARIGFVRGPAGVGVWRLAPPHALRTLPVRSFGNEPNWPFDLSPSGRWLAALAPVGLQLWDLANPGCDWFEPFPVHTNRQRFPSWSVTNDPREDGLLLCYGRHLEWWGFVTNAAGRSAPEAGQPRDVDEISEETLALLSKEFLSGITLTLELDRNLPPVALGGGKLEQILLNLIVNASEAMQGQGRLRLATRLRPGADDGALVLPPRSTPRRIELLVEDDPRQLRLYSKALQGPRAAHFVLEKPVDLDELERTVEVALTECGLGETIRVLQSHEQAEKIDTSEPDRRFTERLARQHDLLKRLRGTAERPNISGLSRHYGVARKTIIRDLQDLIRRQQLPAALYPEWETDLEGATQASGD